MTWTLIIGMGFAIAGYTTKNDCLDAAKSQNYWTTMCIPTPAGATVIGRVGK